MFASVSIGLTPDIATRSFGDAGNTQTAGDAGGAPVLEFLQAATRDLGFAAPLLLPSSAGNASAQTAVQGTQDKGHSCWSLAHQNQFDRLKPLHVSAV